ncbi:hypothetical protein NHX12_015084 [Muraenolepis orangiensis]|uniref:Solute carrier family 15 member 1 n=1 Tax=Muraenolepis orangiensis TaxID=630683 RepID=A0A9Q0I3J3_9TELE|nr:hypothetical protein NHX12_015084 [Muraenolepis orangiensis]
MSSARGFPTMECVEKQRSTFFSIFYLSINAGSLLSTIITPILRAQDCGIHTLQKCYPLAFGVPAALMVVALIVFILGSNMYVKVAPKGNIMMQVCKCIWFAIKNRYRNRNPSIPMREHWMDWKLLIAQIKMVLKVLFLYIPLPMFWTLFDQQGSRWTLQATTMDGNFGALVIQPDQMQTVNPILILAMVPVVDSVIYPLIAKCGLNFTPLKRMTQTLPVFPMSNGGQIKFYNLVNNSVIVQTPGQTFNISPFTSNGEYLSFEGQVDMLVGKDSLLLGNDSLSLNMTEGDRRSFVITLPFQSNLLSNLFHHMFSGRFLNGFSSPLNITGVETLYTNNMSDYVYRQQGSAAFKIQDSLNNECMFSMTLGFGSAYTVVIPGTFSFGPNCAQSILPDEDISPNSVHMAWQIPQYFLMTMGEVVFSVTGLEFSYSQAPSNMKSVLQAGWLFTVAVGNIIVLIVAELAQLPDQWAEYILFASLLIGVCVVFSIMANYYTYVDPTEIESRFAEREPEGKDVEERHLNLTSRCHEEQQQPTMRRKISEVNARDEDIKATNM